jgi:hypothetical protein
MAHHGYSTSARAGDALKAIAPIATSAAAETESRNVFMADTPFLNGAAQ